MSDFQINDAFLVTVLIGAVLPALVGLVTNRFASSGFKSLVLLALSAVSSVLTPLVAVDDVDWQTVLTAFFVTFGSAVLSYYGLLKPTGIAGTDGKIQTTIPGGIGKVDATLPGYEEFDDAVAGVDAHEEPEVFPEETPDE